MPARHAHEPKIGVIADRQAIADFDQTVWSDPVYLRERSNESRAHAIERFLDAEVDLVVVAGGDALIGEVLTAHRQHLRGHPKPLRLFAPRAGRLQTLAGAIDAAPLSPRTFRRLRSALREGNVKRQIVPTLKVSSSARPAAQYGFSFGAGLFYALFEAYHRAGPSAVGAVASTLGGLARQLLLEGGQALEPVRARIAIDGRPRASQMAYLLASSLSRSWMGLDLADAPASMRLGDSGKELIGQLAKSRALPKFLRSAQAAEAFERLHIDGSSGYVLDGELFEPNRPYVVQVKQGPMAHFVTF